METEIERLRKKVENFPSASLYNRLAELVRQVGDETEAEAVCRRCIKEFPRSGQAYVILAELKAGQSKKAEAIHLLQLGLEKDPRSYAAHRLMADLADNRESALHHLRQILTFKPNDPATVQRITELGGSVPATTTALHRALSQPASGSGSGSGASGSAASAAASSATSPGTSRTTRPAVVPRPVPARDSNVPLAFPSQPSSPSSKPPASAPVGTVTTMLRSIGGAKTAVLDALCMEIGVRGSCIVDAKGRVMMSKNLPAGQDELLAALSADILKAATATLATNGASAPATWVVVAVGGQVLTFSRDHSVSVVVLADPGVRPAMLELRARQALIDLGAS